MSLLVCQLVSLSTTLVRIKISIIYTENHNLMDCRSVQIFLS